MEVVETVITISEIADLLNSIFDNDGDGQIIPPEIADVLETFSDGEQGNNDIESFLIEIKDSLMYDEKNTALSEISSRLELIDKRLDVEFNTINYGLGLIIASLVTILSWKFFAWIGRLISV